MTPFRLSIRALPLMVNSIKFGILTRVSRTTASMRKHGSAGLNVPSDGQGNADHDLRIARAALTAKPWMRIDELEAGGTQVTRNHVRAPGTAELAA
jgi:hypothetical protein